MASNAKIGLLLALIVIFVIVFVINGLSGFDNARNDDKLPPIVLNDPTGIKPDIKPEDLPPRQVPERRPEKSQPPIHKESIQEQPSESTSPDETKNHAEPVKPAWPKTYIICKGDNLADIAKKFYGPEEGNRRVNVQRIFEANSKSLESADKIYPGQKLIIPSLRALVRDKNGMESIFPESIFEKVESIGRRHL
jgi:LysM repeat protein